MLWCVFIFGLTASPISTAESTGVVIEQAIHVQNSQLNSWNFNVRKCAHVILFSMLALLLFNATKHNAVTSFIWAMIYAASDEIHQLFVPGRLASINDVILDSIAALVTIIIIIVITQVKRASKFPLE